MILLLKEENGDHSGTNAHEAYRTDDSAFLLNLLNQGQLEVEGRHVTGCLNQLHVCS